MAKKHIINPDLKTEVLHGLGLSLISSLGFFLCMISIVISLSSLAGNLLFILGAGLVIWTISLNVRNPVGGGFRYANIGIKCFILLVLLLVIITVDANHLIADFS